MIRNVDREDSNLSEAEETILMTILMARKRGLQLEDIPGELGIPVEDVRRHLQNILVKLRVLDRLKEA